jgi:hypothetical protein
LNSRKGAYVRTDEFSQRFQPQLATFSELLQLTNRRALAEGRKEALFGRAHGRWATFVSGEFAARPRPGRIGATLEFFICPRFPSKPLADQRRLLHLIARESVSWRSVRFPMGDALLSQHESAVVLSPTSGLSYMESSVWGHVYHAVEVERSGPDITGIHLPAFVGRILVFLEHAKRVYAGLAFDGTLEARIHLDHVRGKPWVHFPDGSPNEGPSSRLDDEVRFSTEFTTARLRTELHTVAADLMRAILFALNWADAATNDAIVRSFIRSGYGYNSWQEPG